MTVCFESRSANTEIHGIKLTKETRKAKRDACVMKSKKQVYFKNIRIRR